MRYFASSCCSDVNSACRYVWFDALTNYLTGCTFPEGERSEFWPASVHIIGKLAMIKAL